MHKVHRPNLIGLGVLFQRLMPCSRHSSGTGVPASACFKIAVIWLSVYFDFFMQNFLLKGYEKILLLAAVIFRGDYQR
jgi:hypothetical protein